jgi:hypothetical protein
MLSHPLPQAGAHRAFFGRYHRRWLDAGRFASAMQRARATLRIDIRPFVSTLGRVGEIIVILLICAACMASAAVMFWLPWSWTLVIGAACTALGTIIGLPAGLWYHIRLYRALIVDGARLERHWWWHPMKMHAALSDPSRARVLPLFRIGAAGSLAMIVGGLLVVVAIWRAAEFGPPLDP